MFTGSEGGHFWILVTMGAALNHEGPKGFSYSGMAENQDLLRRLGSSVNLEVNF